MKPVILLMTGMALSTIHSAGQSQSVLDVLRAIRPGQPAAPAASPSSQPGQSAPAAPQPAASANAGPDMKPIYMAVVTNMVRVTNPVIVTNWVVSTQFTYTTNYYNSQGQLLTLVPGSTAPAFTETRPKAAAAVDPAVVRSNQVQAVRDLLTLAVVGASNTIVSEGSFTRNPNNQIRIPEGVTVFDRKKGQALTTAMNAAADKAAPVALSLVHKAAAQLTPADPAQILTGGSDAATRYLLSAEGQNIVNQVMAAVQSAAAETRVPEAYNAVMLRGGGLLGAVLGTDNSADINAHITRGVMEAIVLKMSAQENTLRSDPSARKTKALQDAFTTKTP